VRVLEQRVADSLERAGHSGSTTRSERVQKKHTVTHFIGEAHARTPVIAPVTNYELSRKWAGNFVTPTTKLPYSIQQQYQFTVEACFLQTDSCLKNATIKLKRLSYRILKAV
jgi:hypothetical protein